MKINWNKQLVEIFCKALLNEISLDRFFLNNLNVEIGFIPVRILKTYPLFKRRLISQFSYRVICIIYLLLAPIYFLLLLINNLLIRCINNYFFKTQNKLYCSEKLNTIVLLSNNKSQYLFESFYKNKFLKSEDTFIYIDINQNTSKFLNQNFSDKINIIQYVSIFELFYSYIYSVFLVYYCIFKLRNKLDILQTYIAFDWVLVYCFLVKLNQKKTIEYVIFSNHFDRWATMFDLLFKKKNLTLIQHGLIDNKLDLNYKLQNINRIGVYDEKSKRDFCKIFKIDNENITFFEIGIGIKLSEISNYNRSILIIGQLISKEMDMQLVNSLKNMFDVYFKPHPWDNKKYYEYKNDVVVITDKDFYPKVKLAITYQSTLGLEYEVSGVEVIWWKNLSLDEILVKVNERMG